MPEEAKQLYAIEFVIIIPTSSYTVSSSSARIVKRKKIHCLFPDRVNSSLKICFMYLFAVIAQSAEKTRKFKLITEVKCIFNGKRSKENEDKAIFDVNTFRQ